MKWSGDIRHIWTREGWLYLAVIRDLHSRRVIGWAVSNRMKRSGHRPDAGRPPNGAPPDAWRRQGLRCAEFVANLRKACVKPHVARKFRYSAIDGRTTRHEGYALSLNHGKRMERAFGWVKTVSGMVQTVHVGLERVRSRFIFTATANNLARLPQLLAA